MDKREIIVGILKDLRPDVESFEGKQLVESGLLDSFDVVSLMLQLNEEFDIEIGVENVSPENFASIEDIELLLDRVRSESY